MIYVDVSQISDVPLGVLRAAVLFAVGIVVRAGAGTAIGEVGLLVDVEPVQPLAPAVLQVPLNQALVGPLHLEGDHAGALRRVRATAADLVREERGRLTAGSIRSIRSYHLILSSTHSSLSRSTLLRRRGHVEGNGRVFGRYLSELSELVSSFAHTFPSGPTLHVALRGANTDQRAGSEHEVLQPI